MAFNNLHDAGASPANTISQLLHIGTGTASNFTFRLGDGTATAFSVTDNRLSAGNGVDIYAGGLKLLTPSSSGSPFPVLFYNSAVSSSSAIGGISQGVSSVAYNSSSDHRLKENVTAMAGALARLAALKPCRFNFIIEPEKRVDGFIAHEVQAVVPESAYGTKDAVDATGAPIYQGVDAAKLVPLLTAALQELAAQVASLQAQVVAIS